MSFPPWPLITIPGGSIYVWCATNLMCATTPPTHCPPGNQGGVGLAALSLAALPGHLRFPSCRSLRAYLAGMYWGSSGLLVTSLARPRALVGVGFKFSGVAMAPSAIHTTSEVPIGIGRCVHDFASAMRIHVVRQLSQGGSCRWFVAPFLGRRRAWAAAGGRGGPAAGGGGDLAFCGD